MKKIFAIFILIFSFISCVDKNGEVKKESIKKEEIVQTKNSKTWKEIKDDEKFKEILNNEVLKFYSSKEEFDKIIDKNDDKLEIRYDEFNKENKITSINEKKSDKIKVELYEKFIEGDDIVSENIYGVRGNITFSCVSDSYFRFDKIIILTDKNRYDINANVFSQELETDRGKTYQFVKFPLDSDKYGMLLDIVNSDSVKIRFAKNDENKDFSLSKQEIETLNDLTFFIHLSLIYSEAINNYLNRAN